MIGLFLCFGAHASQYYMPGLYGNALFGYYNQCFTSGTPVPLYKVLSMPPSWSSDFSKNGGIANYHLDAVFGAQKGAPATGSWINSGLTQVAPKVSQVGIGTILDTALTPQSLSQYPFLLNGGAQWSINPENLASFITKNSASQPLTYLNAAVIEYFSARLAMAASAFAVPQGSTASSFLNVSYPSALINGLQNNGLAVYNEQSILTNFLTAAENLFSWSRYLRNLTVPDGLVSPAVTQANGYTLGALDTFAGAIVITYTSAPLTTPTPTLSNGAANPLFVTGSPSSPLPVAPETYGLCQVVIPPGQTAPLTATTLPSQSPTAAPTNCPVGSTPLPQGLLSLGYPVAVDDSVGFSEFRFSQNYPGLTTYSQNAVFGGANARVVFLPVSSQVYNGASNACAPALYAVQEAADNWANAPVANNKAFFRQVAFQPTQNGNLSNGAYILGVGVANNETQATPQEGAIPIAAAAAPNSITFGSPSSISGWNQYLYNSATPGQAPTVAATVPVDQLPQIPFNYSDPKFINFFADKQPWAVVIVTNLVFVPAPPAPEAPAPGYPNGYYTLLPQPIGLIKLNSIDFPLVFGQDPLAQGYTASQTKGTASQVSQGMSQSYGVASQVVNPLLPLPVRNTLDIAFTQRDVWMGAENLYRLALQQNPVQSTTQAPSAVMYNYSFAYLFLQALFNGYLYSSTAHSLYSVMKQNNEIKGVVKSSVPAGIVGSVTYDYVTENNLPLYPVSTTLPVAANAPKATDIWPINEVRPEPQQSDWLKPGTPLDWIFLRALMVGRALMQNTGVRASALQNIVSIMNNQTVSIPAAQSGAMPVYVGQTNVAIYANQ